MCLLSTGSGVRFPPDAPTIMQLQNPAPWAHLVPLIEHLRKHFRLDWNGIHGVSHWSRVYHNGLKMVTISDAMGRQPLNRDVVMLFAFLHDHEREHDDHDTTHGRRAALNAKNLRGKYFELDDNSFELLCYAMEYHSDGHIEAPDPVVQVCWDADRLDLGRVDVRPDPKYLCTDMAKDPQFIEECYRRSIGLKGEI